MSDQTTLLNTESAAPERVLGLGLVAPPPIYVESPAFTGSLGTLFTLVKERRLDLRDVAVFPICEAYFRYVLGTSNHDLDQAGAALLALAYLVERKALLLLPVEEPEYDEVNDQGELPVSTVSQFDLAIEALKEWQEDRSHLFFRSFDAGSTPYEVPYELENVTVSDLASAFDRLLARANPDPIDPIRRARRSLSEVMDLVIESLSNEWQALEAIAPDPYTRSEAVWWFLAILELMRQGAVSARLRENDVEFRLARSL